MAMHLIQSHVLQGQYMYKVNILGFRCSCLYSYGGTSQSTGIIKTTTVSPQITGTTVGCFGFNGPFETIFQSISSRLSKRGRKRRERIDESKNVQTIPTCTYCKRSRPLPYCNANCRTPRHWKFTQHLRTTRPPALNEVVYKFPKW